MMHLRNRLPIAAAAIFASMSLGASASAAENLNVINFKSKVGSFKLLGTDKPAKGALEFEFTGTVLVSGLSSGNVTASGNLREEYDNPKYKKKVFHGSGKLVITGEFNAVQFFGKNVSGRYTGVGIFRFYGEFDKDLNTGTYWYDGGEPVDWGTGGAQATVPGFNRESLRRRPEPTVKIKGGA